MPTKTSMCDVAFDNLKHNELMNIVNTINIDCSDIRINANLYWKQTANINAESTFTDYVKIRSGVHLRYILLPLLFNIYAEAIFREALDSKNIGIVNVKRINNIR